MHIPVSFPPSRVLPVHHGYPALTHQIPPLHRLPQRIHLTNRRLTTPSLDATGILQIHNTFQLVFHLVFSGAQVMAFDLDDCCIPVNHGDPDNAAIDETTGRTHCTADVSFLRRGKDGKPKEFLASYGPDNLLPLQTSRI